MMRRNKYLQFLSDPRKRADYDSSVDILQSLEAYGCTQFSQRKDANRFIAACLYLGRPLEAYGATRTLAAKRLKQLVYAHREL